MLLSTTKRIRDSSPYNREKDSQNIANCKNKQCLEWLFGERTIHYEKVAYKMVLTRQLCSGMDSILFSVYEILDFVRDYL